MRKALLTGAALAAICVPSLAMAKDIVVGVSWSNFQEERWKTDEAAIKQGLAPSAPNTSRPTLRPIRPSNSRTWKA